MIKDSVEHSLALLCAEAEAADQAGDLPAAAFAYAVACTMLPPTGAEARLYELRLARARCLHRAGDYSAEAEELRALEALAAGLGDTARPVQIGLLRAHLLLAYGDYGAAQRLAARGLMEAQASGEHSLAVASLLALAEASLNLGERHQARAHVDRALAACLALGDRRAEAQARRILGLALLDTSDDALVQLRSALALCRETGDRSGEALALSALGGATADRAEARAVYLQGLAVAESTGERASETLLANNLSRVYLSLGLYGQARAYAARAVRLGRALGARELLAAALESLGGALSGLGQHEQAGSALREARALAESHGRRATAARALICLARVALDQGRDLEAARDLDLAIAHCAAAGNRADEATALAWRSLLHLRAGEGERALHLSGAATARLAGSVCGAFPPHEVWWLHYLALTAARGAPEPHGPGAYAGPDAAPEHDAGAAAPRYALAQARATMFAAIASLSDMGLRRSYLGRVTLNRAIVEALAAEDPRLSLPAPVPLSHHSLQNQMTRLLGITARLNDLRDGAALREIFLDELLELCGAERLLLVLGPSLETPDAVVGRGVPPGELAALREAVTPSLREALRRRRALSASHHDDEDAATPPALRLRSGIAVPLVSGARTIGAFYADVRALFGPFSGSDLDLVGLLAAQAATALENARLYAQTLRAKEELERQVAARTADLRAANTALATRAVEAQAAFAAAQAASAAKSAFLANVSHELRTPLNAVIGFAQVLQRDQGLSVRQRDLLQIIGRSGDHLLGLINDVLELSKIEAGRLSISPEPFDLHATMKDLDNLYRLRAEVRHLVFTVRASPELPRHVVGDEGRLRQILFNLVGNALKFTRTGSITVEADSRAEGSRLRLCITVTDTGEGIAPDELEELFKPFAQTESGRRSHDGTGLGLALSRQLARLMGGEISLASVPGAGSTFTVEILVDLAAEPVESGPRRQILGLVTAGRRYRVVVADEDWQSRRLMAEWLHEAGLEVREAADSTQALAIWSAWRPHIVLLALSRSPGEAVEAARTIKESPGGRATLLLATIDGAGGPPAAAVSYCDDLLPEPVGHDELLTSIANHLGVDLRYAAETPQHETPLTKGDLGTLPPALRAEVAAAAASSDPAAVAEALAKVSAGWPGLARRLDALADEFQFETIELLATEDEQC